MKNIVDFCIENFFCDIWNLKPQFERKCRMLPSVKIPYLKEKGCNVIYKSRHFKTFAFNYDLIWENSNDYFCENDAIFNIKKKKRFMKIKEIVSIWRNICWNSFLHVKRLNQSHLLKALSYIAGYNISQQNLFYWIK